MSGEILSKDLIAELRKPSLLPITVIDQPFVNKMKDPAGGDLKAIGIPVGLIPHGFDVKSLKPLFEEWRTKPERKKGTVTLKSEQSFIDFVNRYKNAETTVIFAEAQLEDGDLSASIKAVFDYHPSSGDIEKAENAGFQALYDFPISKEFKSWYGESGNQLSQRDLTNFLNDNIADLAAADWPCGFDMSVLSPTYAEPAQIFELSYGLEINAKKKYYQHQKFMTGESNVQFTEEHEGAPGQPLKVPGWFKLQIPVFEGGATAIIPVRLRYAILDDRLHWTFDLWNPKVIFTNAFRLACANIQSRTSTELFNGHA